MFSVIMAAYNAERYLRPAVESIINQSFRDWELLLVNDGSTDNTLHIAAGYAAKDSRIRLINKATNSGISDTTNSGLREARFNWIAILDSDDVAAPNRLELQAEAIQRQPAVIAWAGYGDYINEQGRLLYRSDLGPKSEAEYQALRARHEPVMFIHSTLTYRRDIALEVGGYSTQIAAAPDLDLIDRLSDHGTMLTLPHVLVQYRVHTSSATFTKFARQANEIRYLYERRAHKDAGQGWLTYEEYERRQAQKPALRRMRERTQMLSRLHWYRAGLAMGDHRLGAFAANLLTAAVYSPIFILRKVSGQFRQRLAGS